MEQPHKLPCLAVRSPLGVPFLGVLQRASRQLGNGSSLDHFERRQQQQQLLQHDGRVRPWICALLVACDVLDVSVETLFTAAALFHRYHALASDWKDLVLEEKPAQDRSQSRPPTSKPSKKNSNVFATNEILTACLYLACKSEEEPRRMRDVINCVHQLSIQGATIKPLGESPPKLPLVQLAWDPCPPNLPLVTGASAGAASNDPSSAPYVTAQRRLVAAEQHVLRWIAFDCTVSHPHRAVVLLCRTLAQSSSAMAEAAPVEGERIGAVEEGDTFWTSLQLAAWQRLNAAVFSVACLSHGVWPLACAAVDLELDLRRQRQRQGLNPLSHASSQPEFPPSIACPALLPATPPRRLPQSPSMDSPTWYVQCGVPATQDEVRAARTDLEEQTT